MSFGFGTGFLLFHLFAVVLCISASQIVSARSCVYVYTCVRFDKTADFMRETYSNYYRTILSKKNIRSKKSSFTIIEESIRRQSLKIQWIVYCLAQHCVLFNHLTVQKKMNGKSYWFDTRHDEYATNSIYNVLFYMCIQLQKTLSNNIIIISKG